MLFRSAKSQVGGAFAEVSSLKTQFEVVMNQAGTPSITSTDAGYIGQTESGGRYCKLSLVTAKGGVNCQIQNANTAVNGDTITLLRDATTGVWSCTSADLDAKFKPAGCS